MECSSEAEWCFTVFMSVPSDHEGGCAWRCVSALNGPAQKTVREGTLLRMSDLTNVAPISTLVVGSARGRERAHQTPWAFLRARRHTAGISFTAKYGPNMESENTSYLGLRRAQLRITRSLQLTNNILSPGSRSVSYMHAGAHKDHRQTNSSPIPTRLMDLIAPANSGFAASPSTSLLPSRFSPSPGSPYLPISSSFSPSLRFSSLSRLSSVSPCVSGPGKFPPPSFVASMCNEVMT